MTAADATLAAKPHRLTEARAVIAASAMLSLVLALPILAMSVPWFCDLYFHRARMVVLENPQAAYIGDWYGPDWRLVPNLAMDLIVPGLAEAIGTAAATRVFIALTLVLTFAGSVALHHALHRKLTWFPLLAGLFIYNWITFLGFANVLFGNALMLWAAALWFWSRERPLAFRIALGTACAPILYLCHLFALGLYGLVVAGAELARLRQETPLRARTVAHCLALTVVPFVVPFVLLLTSRTVAASTPGIDYVLAAKLFAWLTPFITVDIPIDLAVAVGTLALLWLLARQRALHVAPELRPALVALPLLVVVIPTSFFGTDLADFRLPALGIFIAVAACRCSEQMSRHLQRGVLAGAAALFVLRMTGIAIDFATAEPEMAEITQQYRAMQPGSVLFTGTFEHPSFLVDLFTKPENWLAPWRRRDVLPFRHMGTLALLYQPVLVPETTMIDGQQPVTMLPPFRALKALQSQEHVAHALTSTDDLDRWLDEIKETVTRPPYHFTAIYIALSDPHGLAKAPPGIVERFSRYNYRIWDATEWMAR
jgi:hypothetical protein